MFEVGWQDVVLSIGNIIFFIALLPSIFSKNKPSFWTGIMTSIVLTSFVITYFTLELWMAVFATSLSTGAWWVLTIQKYLIDRSEKNAEV